MRLQEFPVLADENIQPEVIAWLRARGCDVVDVHQLGLVGSDDLSLLRLACSQGRIILTHDSDFGALSIARLEPMVGLVFLRPGHIDPQFTLHTMKVLFDLDLELRAPFLLVAKKSGDEVAVRLRKL